jgi:ligand-binding sensor domain-containing protein
MANRPKRSKRTVAGSETLEMRSGSVLTSMEQRRAWFRKQIFTGDASCILHNASVGNLTLFSKKSSFCYSDFYKIDSKNGQSLENNHYHHCSSMRLANRNHFPCQSLVLLILLMSTRVSAQQMDFKLTTYGQSQGLENTMVQSFMQDKKGLLWLGTMEGLSCFDGYRFRMYRNKIDDSNSMSSNYITALAEDKNGLIWIGYAQGGVTSFNPGSGEFRNYTLFDQNNKKYPAEDIRMIFVDSENDIWISMHTHGFMRLDRVTGRCAHFSLVSANVPLNDRKRLYDHVSGIVEKEKGKFWMATADGLYHFDKRTAQLAAIPIPIPVENFIRSDLFIGIQADGDKLWMNSWAGGISSYDTKTKTWNNYKYNPGRISGTSNIVYGMVQRGRDTIWVATSNDGGFGYFLKSKKRFHFYEDKLEGGEQLPAGEFYGLWSDRSANIWASHESGLIKIRKENRKFIFHNLPVRKSDNGAMYVVNNLFENEKFKIIGTAYADGLHVENKLTGEQKTLAFKHDLDEGFLIVKDVFEDSRGTIWVATRDYIFLFDQDSMTLKEIPQPPSFDGTANSSNLYQRFCEDRTGKIWIVTRKNGLFSFNPGNMKYEHYAPSQKGRFYIPVSGLNAMTLDKFGHIWIGGNNGYLAYLNFRTSEFVRISEKSLGKAAGHHVQALLADKKGVIWVGTHAGLLSYEFRKTGPEQTCMLTAEHGLKGGIVTDLCEDLSGMIWCITNSSLCVLRPENHTITTFGESDGIKYAHTGSRLVLTASGKIRFSLARGYYEFDPGFLKVRRSKVPVVVTAFKVNDQERYFGEEIARQGRVSLKPDENRISFDFAAIDLVQAEKQHYAYMLEGVDDHWINSGSRRYVSYTNLPGGDYKFMIRASSVDEDWKAPTVIMPVYIETVFYKQWWFRGLMLLVTGTVIYLIFRYRIRQEQKIFSLESRANSLEKEKAMVMYDSLKQQLNPHFLFNSLASLSSLIRIDQLRAGEFLEGMSKTYRYILKNRDNELVPLASELQFTETYIKLQKTRFKEGLQVNISIDPEYIHWKIAPVTLQNLIENAIKHNVITSEEPLVIDILTENAKLVVRNKLQKKKFVETSNRKGLANMNSMYQYLTDRTIEIIEDKLFFTVKIPLI